MKVKILLAKFIAICITPEMGEICYYYLLHKAAMHKINNIFDFVAIPLKTMKFKNTHYD